MITNDIVELDMYLATLASCTVIITKNDALQRRVSLAQTSKSPSLNDEVHNAASYDSRFLRELCSIHICPSTHLPIRRDIAAVFNTSISYNSLITVITSICFEKE